MLTPLDKILRRGNDIIQIVVTRKCDLHTCANCTQLLPFRQDPVEMTLECAELALQSVADYPGVVAMFGGNPVTHSRFTDLCSLWAKYIPDQSRRGLWTNNLMTEEKAAAARDCFYPHGRFNLNLHCNEKARGLFDKYLPGVKVWGTNPSHHGMLLGRYSDLGVSDEDWVEAREKCDINQKWSAGVYAREVPCDRCAMRSMSSNDFGQHETPCGGCGTIGNKGTIQRPFSYFCEVAGSIDGVTGENNGVPAVPGWWRRPIADFDHQIQNCCNKSCVVPLRMKGHMDHEKVYDITPSVAHLTEQKKPVVSTVVHGEKRDQIRELTDYTMSRS